MIHDNSNLGVRWTIGDVTSYGFETLRLSIWGAHRVFGPTALYCVCVNSIPVDEAIRRTGEVPVEVMWRDCTGEIPYFIREHLDAGMAEGAGWKFAMLRAFPNMFELALDNDCILWEMPEALRLWRMPEHRHRCVTAEDVVAMFGQFSDQNGTEPRNGGIRGFPPGFDFEAALRQVLQENPVILTSELDEQGLQSAALRKHADPLAISLEEVTICSPWPPHLPHLGCCGAHFCGLNARSLPWEWQGRPAIEHTREHWMRHRDTVREKTEEAVAAGS